MTYYREVHSHLQKIAEKCGRKFPGEIELVAVSKNCSKRQIQDAYEQGARCFGESRVMDALRKLDAFPRIQNWHFIGTLQKNKVRKVVGKFSLIHSVHSFLLAEKISSVAQEAGTIQPVLLQVNVAREESKHGFLCEELFPLFNSLLALPGIQISGLMTIAPFTENQTKIRKCFCCLRELLGTLREAYPACHPWFFHLSMGMSHDYKVAIEEGATLLRLGRLLFEHPTK